MNSFINAVLAPRFAFLLDEVIHNPDIFWTVLPFIVVAFSMQVYFGRNRSEELGWNSAFGNSISFTFVSARLIRHMITAYPGFLSLILGDGISRLYITMCVISLGIIMVVANLYHARAKKILFFLSSSLFINGFAVTSIILVLTNAPLDLTTLLAAFLFFLAFMGLEFLIREAVRPSPQAQAYLWRLDKKHKEMRMVKTANRKRKWIEWINKWKVRLARARIRF